MSAPSFIDELIEEQRDLTAVEQFSRWHQVGGDSSPVRNYANVMPLTAPRPGRQYAFEVDLDKCSGCKACVTACHSLNGLEEDEAWRSVGLLIAPRRITSPEPSAAVAIHQHVTTACHHCVDPGCLNGCPVLAYDKDPVTGIVRHLDDQCMGCSYCVMKCPYEVPKFSDRLGIVRKCDMCSNRLAIGEAPACAQACPNEAIRITVVNQSDVTARFRANERAHRGESEAGRVNSFLPDSPDPVLTLPTTRFVSRRPASTLAVAADHASLRLDSAHAPLVLMLVLTQSAAGLLLASTTAGASGMSRHFLPLNVGAFALLSLGLMASVLHLGRPLKAWRAFLGWRRSWLSREIIGFNVFAVLASLAALAAWLPAAQRWQLPLTSTAAAGGLIGVFASSMVYVDTRRPVWGARRTMGNFFGTTLLLGAMLAAATFAGMNRSEAARIAMAIAAGSSAVLFVWRRLELQRALADERNSLHWNARVIQELLPGLARWMNLLFFVSIGAGLIVVGGLGGLTVVWAGVAAGAASGAEIMGRYAYFVAGGAKRMPGGLAE